MPLSSAYYFSVVIAKKYVKPRFSVDCLQLKIVMRPDCLPLLAIKELLTRFQVHSFHDARPLQSLLADKDGLRF